MIYSINDYEEKNELKLIKTFLSSKERQRLVDLKEYAEGLNPEIAKRKKMIYAEFEKADGTQCSGLIENPYVPNLKSSYGFYSQTISQKVNALTSETPLIEKVEDGVRKLMGFATKKASYIASMQGYSFTFVGMNNQFVVFETENVIPFADDLGNLKVLLRIWQSTIQNKTITFYERYNENGVATFKFGTGIDGVQVVKKLEPYKTKVYTSSLSVNKIVENIGGLPIYILKNNEDLKPDLTPSIKSKIDILDIIESDLYNNIQEFSDVWLSVSADVDVETAQRIRESIRKTQTMVAKDGVLDVKTLQIPYEARQSAIGTLKQELVEDAGIIDFKEIKGNATATEINARTYKLTQKVSDFEWYVDEWLTKVVLMWQRYNNLNFDVKITFQKLFIKNNLEAVNIANSVYDKISQKSYLKLLQQANVIDDADEEIKQIDKESVSKFSLGDDDGYSTQGNGQDNFIGE